jgi:hypothetical protein
MEPQTPKEVDMKLVVKSKQYKSFFPLDGQSGPAYWKTFIDDPTSGRTFIGVGKTMEESVDIALKERNRGKEAIGATQ